MYAAVEKDGMIRHFYHKIFLEVKIYGESHEIRVYVFLITPKKQDPIYCITAHSFNTFLKRYSAYMTK
jgi:hypothetical protein